MSESLRRFWHSSMACVFRCHRACDGICGADGFPVSCECKCHTSGGV
jgi:hypothetical protein